jgi:membrane associated rhomboid family serine protease
MIVSLFAALVGGIVTLAGLLPYGALIALISMPFGGSLAALLAGLLLAVLRSRAERRAEAEPDAQQKAAA